MTDDEQDTRARSIQKRRQQARLWEQVCLENHHNPQPRRRPEPAFHNAVLSYYSELRHYLKNEDSVADYWNPDDPDDIDLPSGFAGLKDLDGWKYRQRQSTRREFDPNDGVQLRSQVEPDYLAPETASQLLDVLDEAAYKLGFTADANETREKTTIDDDLLERAEERARELRRQA